MKFIREGRFGPPKCWKTGAVVGTYPKPLLVFEYEKGGLEVIREPITFLTLEELEEVLKGKVPVKGIYALDLTFKASLNMEVTYSPAKDRKGFDDTVAAINILVKASHQLPFKTIVIDTVTGLSDCIYSHQAITNSAALADARKWAGNIGEKVKQVINYVTATQANTVFIFHTEVDKDEDTKILREQPMVYSKLRNFVGALFSQFFYQQIRAGKPVLRTQAFELVSGIGCRWPIFTQEIIDPTFDAIYGKEPDVYK